MAAFLKDLFGDEIKSEAAERERLLREELPKLRASRSGSERALPRMPHEPPSRSYGSGDPPTRPAMPASMRDALDVDGIDLNDSMDKDPETRRVQRPPAVIAPAGRAPPPLPGVKPSNGGGPARPLPGMRPAPPQQPGNRPPSPPPIRSMIRSGNLLETDDDELTVTHPPRGVALTPAGPTRGAAPAPMRAPAPRDGWADPDDSPSRRPNGEALAPEQLVGTTVDGRYRIERVLANTN